VPGFIIGTCGHVDHGKSTLIRALNGFDGDTLKEEKARGITIELSFSHLTIGNKTVSFIDVPGHETLVKNMISGAFGFDAVMIVVSAKEGVKPQTVEHLEILELLGIKEAILVISKKDLVTKAELEENIREIQATVAKYALHLQAVVPVSIYDADSLNYLKEKLFSLNVPQRVEGHFFRLYIDRVFSLKGQGCVVTGTVLGKAVTLQDTLFVCDIGKTCKIRQMQVHHRNVPAAPVAHRVALNLANIKTDHLKKGFLLSQKGYIRGFKTIDISFQTLGKNKRVKHNHNYTIYIGSRRFEAHITLFGTTEELAEGFATVKAQKAIFSVYGEKLLLREGGRTIAGATVLNPVADPLRKRQKYRLLEALQQKDFNSAYRILLKAHRHGLGLISSAQRFALSHKKALEAAREVEGIFVDEKSLMAYPVAAQQEVDTFIRKIYDKNPYALLSAASLKLRLPWAGESFIVSALRKLVSDKVLVCTHSLYRSTQLQNSPDTLLESRLLTHLKSEGITPSAPNTLCDTLDLDRKAGATMLDRLCRKQEVVKVATFFIAKESLHKVVSIMKTIIMKEGYVDIYNFKQYSSLSRKYRIAYLEYLEKLPGISNENGKRLASSEKKYF